LIVIDNASDIPLEDFYKDIPHKIVRLEKNIGVYPTFWEALKHTDANILAFFHTDLIVLEKDWDIRLMEKFSSNPKIGLIGFIGSTEIDSLGGRGLGTTSNFQGVKTVYRDVTGKTREWQGSSAKVHGKKSLGYTKACVVDGCSMVFRRSVLEGIFQRPDFPPHHFYDRLLSCEVMERGYEIGVLGIACDHISNQSVGGSLGYEMMAGEWAISHHIDAGTRPNWDSVIYQEAERQWLSEYRDRKHLVPCKI